MHKAGNAPFFIIGVHRSGTTLLRFMLSSSPRLYIPPESDFIPRFFLRHPTRPLNRRKIASLLDIIFDQYRFVRSWEGARPTAEQIMARMEAPTPAAFLDTLYSLYAAQHGAERWGDKTPIYSSYVPLLDVLFPDAQFIHLIRDGRDVALSMLDQWGSKEPHVDIFFTARNWLRRIRAAQAAGRVLGPHRFYELRYESLVQAPEETMRRICGFLGEPFVDAMAEQHRLARKVVAADGFHAPVRQPPSTGRIGRWEREMSTPDLRLFQAVAGPLLYELGYELADAGPMPTAEQIRLAALAAKYGTLQIGRRMLQAAGLMPPI